MRRGFTLLAEAIRTVTPANLLQTIRHDPGMTANYYANRYYGKDKVAQLNHVLWTVLKRSGKVDIDRTDGADAAPRWYPLFASPRRHMVRRHNPDEEDLSVLQQAPAWPEAPAMPADDATASSSNSLEAEAESLELESAIVHLVTAVPEKDIQYYILELPVAQQRRAPAAFKRLREAGLLTRKVTEQGTYVWH